MRLVECTGAGTGDCIKFVLIFDFYVYIIIVLLYW